MEAKLNMVAKTLMGLEPVLAKEIEEIGGQDIQILKRAVSFTGEKEILYKAHLWLRTAMKILIPIKTFEIKSEQDLYDKTKTIEWEKYFTHRKTIAIDPVIHSKILTHSHYAGLKVKDAIVDRFREQTRYRPSVDTQHPDFKINLHVFEDEVTLSADATGNPMNQRGYRSKSKHPSPLNEVLAAGMLLLSGWDKQTPILDPFCGSGTILAEAGMMAANLPPAYQRRDFLFLNWEGFEFDKWINLQQTAILEANPKLKIKLRGYDISDKVLSGAKQNITEIPKLRNKVRFEQNDFFGEWSSTGPLLLITNPPYGERLEHDRDIEKFYSEIGRRLKFNFPDTTVCIIGPSGIADKNLGFKPELKVPMKNGALDVKLLKFSIYKNEQEKVEE